MTRELIVLAVAVMLRCDGCITVHTDAAIKRGASKEEISAALGVAVSVNAGATLVYSAPRDRRLPGSRGTSRGANEVIWGDPCTKVTRARASISS